ncbi:MAG: ABC transporter substrate-binding protein [Candidatus Rokubacteria bacterium]|nr:ABC transporter substrate-binding protein [Candidatus Rokubacteria bacterium]
MTFVLSRRSISAIGRWPIRVVAALLCLAVLVAPVLADAQSPAKVPRIGFLSPFSPSTTAVWHQAFRQGLRDLGWVEGTSIRIEYRYSEGQNDRLPRLAAELVHLNVDLIVVSTSTDGVAAKNASRTIPIVMASAADPIASGLVESLARPGGNVTGLSSIAPEMAGKRLALLKEIVPTLARVAVFWNPAGTTSRLSWNELQVPARELGVQLHSLELRRSGDFIKAFDDAVRTRAGAVAIMPDPLFAGNLKQLADLAAKRRLPSVFHLREFVEVGGLMAYGVDRSDMFRRAATYVDKILKGARPADLPVEQPTKFELVISLKTAKALGLTIPQSMLLRADDAIQ